MSENCGLSFGTVTLSRELLLKPLVSQLKKTHHRLRVILSRHFIDFELVIELTKTGNIHYHFKGISYHSSVEENNILVTDELKSEPKYFGFSKIDAVTLDNGVDNYLVKSIDMTKSVLNKRKIDLNVYPVICNKETKILRERSNIPINAIQTTFLDILETIEEEIGNSLYK